jgi:thiol-disulfide isomerase/thioredoxin
LFVHQVKLLEVSMERGQLVRSTFLIFCLLLFPLANAQEPEHDPADPYWSSIQRRGVPHHEEMIGRALPDVTFRSPDGNEIALSSYRGKPLLIDLWATWCAPCVAALPSLKSIYAEFKDKGLEVISFDQDSDPEHAAKYLARHHYEWKNFHDGERTVQSALQADGIPLILLIDANGKIVYFDFGGRETDLRKAIAALGPDFSRPSKSRSDQSENSPDQVTQQ